MTRTVVQQIRELQAMTPAQLARRYDELHGQPPRVRNKRFLQRKIAWKIQELAFGGLSDRAKTRLDELVAQIELPLGDLANRPRRKPRSGSANGPMTGTTLVRQWKGQEIRVAILDQGFEWEGVVYRSLSAVAKAVTGSHWNGHLFFGLRTRSKSR